MPVSRPDIAVNFKTATLAISLMPCHAQAVFGPASEGSRAVTHPFLNLYHIMSMMQVNLSRKSQNVWPSDSATLAHERWFRAKGQNGSKRRSRNERTTDKEKLAPAYFKIITGKTLGATQV